MSLARQLRRKMALADTFFSYPLHHPFLARPYPLPCETPSHSYVIVTHSPPSCRSSLPVHICKIRPQKHQVTMPATANVVVHSGHTSTSLSRVLQNQGAHKSGPSVSPRLLALRTRRLEIKNTSRTRRKHLGKHRIFASAVHRLEAIEPSPLGIANCEKVQCRVMQRRLVRIRAHGAGRWAQCPRRHCFCLAARCTFCTDQFPFGTSDGASNKRERADPGTGCGSSPSREKSLPPGAHP